MTAPRATIPGFRKWLKAVPQPAKLKCGETIIRISSSNNRWHEAEQSVLALDSSSVQALNGQDEVLRAFRIKDEDEAEALEPQRENWPASPEAEMAQIICASNDRAASRHEAAYKMAFQALQSMYEAQSARLEEALMRAARAEAAVLKLSRPQVREVVVEAEQEDGASALLTQVLGGALVQMTQGKQSGEHQ